MDHHYFFIQHPPILLEAATAPLIRQCTHKWVVPPTLRNSDLNHCIFLLYKSARFASRFHYPTSFKYPHICNPWGKFLPVGTICTTTDMISIPMGAMYLHARTFCTFAHTTSIPVGAMYLHSKAFCFYPMSVIYLQARMSCTLAPTTSIPMGAVYLHARTSCTLPPTTSIHMGGMYLHARTFCALTDTILYH